MKIHFINTKIILTFLLSACMILFSCEIENITFNKDKEDNINNIPLTEKQKSIIQSGNKFTFDLLKNNNELAGENFMISPLSISLALGMTANGAKNNTLNEMLTVLGFDNVEIEDFNKFFKYIVAILLGLDDKVTLSIANSIWYNNNFNVLQSFLDVNQKYYNAEISALDFCSADAPATINNWVANATNDKITEIIEQIGPDVVMYLINAIYFYGEWKYEFDKSQTENKKFYLHDGTAVEVPMMMMETELKYYSDGSTQIIELPYGNGNFVMNLLLPANEQTPANLLNSLTVTKWNDWTKELHKREILLTMPKFKFEYEKGLIPVLESLGINDLFNGNADLSGINGMGGLCVSDVKHKTFIDVNEEGTEAAAVTSVEVIYTGEDALTHIVMNRPFVFMIREVSTESILFAGVVANPNKE